MELTWIFLAGIVMTVIPTLLILGLSVYTLYAFLGEDDDAKAVFHVALGFFVVGVICLIAHFLGVSF